MNHELKTTTLCLICMFCACGWINDLRQDDGAAAPEKAANAAPPVAATPSPTATNSPGIFMSSQNDIDAAESLAVIRKRLDAKERLERGLPPETPTPVPTLVVIDHGRSARSSSGLGLMWTSTAAGAFSHEDAAAYCTDLQNNGFSDWRLPTREETAAILAVGIKTPPSALVQYLWTADANPVRGYKVIDFKTEAISSLDAAMAHAICVRSLDPQP